VRASGPDPAARARPFGAAGLVSALTVAKAQARARIAAWLRRHAPGLAAHLARRLAASRQPFGPPPADGSGYAFKVHAGLEAVRARDPRRVVDVRPAQSYTRVAPVFVNIERLDPERARWFRHGLETPCAVPAASVAAVGRAIMFGHGYVATPDRNLLIESICNTSSINPEHNLGLVRSVGGAVWTGGSIETSLKVSGPATTLRNLGERVWGHWLFELLPRIEIFRAHPEFARLKFVVRRHRWRTTVEALFACGVAPRNVIEVPDDQAVEFENFVCASPVLKNQLWMAPQNIAFVRDAGLRYRADALARHALDTRASPGRRRLFVTRDDATHRRLLNQDAIAETLRLAGFEAVIIGDMDFARQVDLFAGAEAVAVVLGSGASDIVFAPPGTPIVLLVPNRDYPFFFLDIATMAGHPVALVFGESVKRVNTAYSDFTVAPEDLRAGLAALDMLA